MSDNPQTGNTSLSAAIQDRDGNTSSTRVAGFYSLLVATLMMVFGQFTPHPADPASVISLLVFSATCFALKLPEWFGMKR